MNTNRIDPAPILVLGSLPSKYRKILQELSVNYQSDEKELLQKLHTGSFLIILGEQNKNSVSSRTRLACEIAAVHQQIVLLMVENNQLEECIYQCQKHLVFVLSLNSTALVFSQTVHFLLRLLSQWYRLNHELEQGRKKMQEEKIVTRAKLKLIEEFHFSEEKAHAYIGKKAMDHSMTRVEIARMILDRLQNHPAK